MRRIAVLNQKGGVGKTTTTANLGAALARAGSRVLLIDLDPQGHLSLHFGVELRDEESSLYDVLTGTMSIAEVARSVHDHITLVPADIDLAGAESELVSVTGREVLLREALDAAPDAYDAVLIDCPPSLGVLTVNALVAANEIVIPLQAHFLALQGLSRLFDTVTLVRQRINPSLRVSGIALCMHDSTTRLAGEIADDLAQFLKNARGTGVPWAEARVYDTCIRRNIKLAESSSFGQTIFDYAPRSNGAADYAALAQEIFGDAAMAPREVDMAARPARRITTEPAQEPGGSGSAPSPSPGPEATTPAPCDPAPTPGERTTAPPAAGGPPEPRTGPAEPATDAGSPQQGTTPPVTRVAPTAAPDKPDPIAGPPDSALEPVDRPGVVVGLPGPR
jgi:chromosome partitioning protein